MYVTDLFTFIYPNGYAVQLPFVSSLFWNGSF